MAPRHSTSLVTIEDFKGYDAFHEASSLPPDTWPDSLNVVVTANGNAQALRSPANLNNALANSKPILSGAYYDRAIGVCNIFDTQTAGTTNVSTYASSTGVNTLVRSAQANAAWVSTNVDNRLFRVNGVESVQIVSGLTAYAIGIAKPLAAPSVSIVAGGTGTIAVSVNVSYAYRNSVTGHVGECSAVSGASGPTSGGNKTLRTAVVASTQTGVDGIVLFITQDAGSVRYLYVDANGDPVVNTNTTANIDISAALLVNLNFNVQETTFNVPPPAGATHISRWKNRLMYCGYSGATVRQLAYYSGFDQIFYGSPFETVPPANIIAVPNKGESLFGGIDTPVGWLGLTDQNAYMVTGSPTDKIDSGENQLQPTEQFRQLNWNLGTRSIQTLAATPWGIIFLDANKRLQFWPFTGQPIEIAMGLRPELDAIQDTDAARAMVQGTWFQSGKNAGFYVLIGSTSGSTNNRVWVITIMTGAAGLQIAGAPSDIAAQCVFISKNASTRDTQCVIGVTDKLQTILDFDTAGAGWPTGTQLYFELIANNASLFSTLFSIRYDATRPNALLVQVRASDGTNIRALNPRKVDGSYSARVNRYGARQKLRFTFASDDVASQEVQNVRLITDAKRRVI